jgi:hypothetical protein
LLAICSAGHIRTVPFRLLKTSEEDRTPLYGRPFRCPTCNGRDVTLFAIESQAELDDVRRTFPSPQEPAQAPTTHRRPDPNAGYV